MEYVINQNATKVVSLKKPDSSGYKGVIVLVEGVKVLYISEEGVLQPYRLSDDDGRKTGLQLVSNYPKLSY